MFRMENIKYTFDAVASMLDLIVDEIPDQLLQGLDGVFLVDGEKHNEKIPSENYYVMGQFHHGEGTRPVIDLYYGSIIAVHGNLETRDLMTELRKIVRHELRHHMETLAGCDDLVRLDEMYVRDALEKLGPAEQ